MLNYSDNLIRTSKTFASALAIFLFSMLYFVPNANAELLMSNPIDTAIDDGIGICASGNTSVNVEYDAGDIIGAISSIDVVVGKLGPNTSNLLYAAVSVNNGTPTAADDYLSSADLSGITWQDNLNTTSTFTWATPITVSTTDNVRFDFYCSFDDNSNDYFGMRTNYNPTPKVASDTLATFGFDYVHYPESTGTDHDPIFYVWGSTSTTPLTETISFTYPTSTSEFYDDGTTGMVSAFSFALDNLITATSTEYDIDITLTDEWTSSTYALSKGWFSADNSTENKSILSYFMLGGFYDRQWKADVILSKRSSTDLYGPYLTAATTSLTFWVGVPRQVSSTNPWIPINQLNSSTPSSSIVYTEEVCSYLDFACYARNIVRWFFVPQYNASDIFSYVFGYYKTIPPLSIFYSLENTLDSSKTTLANATSSDLYMRINIANQTSSIKVAGDSYLEDIFGKPIVNIFYNIVIVIFTLIYLTLLLRTIMTL